jgi:hypothetical protein
VSDDERRAEQAPEPGPEDSRPPAPADPGPAPAATGTSAPEARTDAGEPEPALPGAGTGPGRGAEVPAARGTGDTPAHTPATGKDPGGAGRPEPVPPGHSRSRAVTDPFAAPRPAAGRRQETFPGLRPRGPRPAGPATLWSALAAGLLSALLLGDGLGVNLLVVAVVAALAALRSAVAAGRRPRPWTAVWALGALALLIVPALRDAAWPTFLAILAALMAGSLALHGGRTWPGVLLGSVGLLTSLVEGPAWALRGLRERLRGSRRRWGPVVRTAAIAALLLTVFGALFAGADAAFADLLGGLTPDIPVAEGPWRFLLFLVGTAVALAAAHVAAAPVHWDRIRPRPGRERSRWEWALPLVVLDLLFTVFIAVQLAVLFGGYDKVLAETGLTYAEYARQGFWQLLGATLLTLAVIALALRWAPRRSPGDRTLVRGVLGALCLLTLVVVASALRRMDLYVDAYGLTRLRVSVAAMELWLGLVLVLIMAAGLFGARWLPRAVGASAVAAVLAFGLLSPDGLVAERNVDRYERSGKIDVDYLSGLSADAVPALDRLPEPLRSCALAYLAEDLDEESGESATSWHATSWSVHRARELLRDRAVTAGECARNEDYRTAGAGSAGPRR